MPGLWTCALPLLGVLPAQPQFPSRPDSFLCRWPFLGGGCEQGRLKVIVTRKALAYSYALRLQNHQLAP